LKTLPFFQKHHVWATGDVRVARVARSPEIIEEHLVKSQFTGIVLDMIYPIGTTPMLRACQVRYGSLMDLNDTRWVRSFKFTCDDKYLAHRISRHNALDAVFQCNLICRCFPATYTTS